MRGDETILYGAHNGIIYEGAERSALEHDRDYTVDSREVLELLADGEYDSIRRLQGYGVLTWMVPGDPYVNLVRLSQDSEIEAALLKAGGVVWGSTQEIIRDACEIAGLRIKTFYELPLIGHKYRLKPHGLFESNTSGIWVQKRPNTNWTRAIEAEPESWETRLIEKYKREAKELAEKYGLDENLQTSWERDADDPYPSIKNTYV